MAQEPPFDGRREETVGPIAVGEELMRVASQVGALRFDTFADSMSDFPNSFLLGCTPFDL